MPEPPAAPTSEPIFHEAPPPPMPPPPTIEREPEISAIPEVPEESAPPLLQMESPMETMSAMVQPEEKKEEPAFSVPIPGTRMTEEPPVVAKKEKAPLDFEGTELKPEGFVQIACFFPAGQENPAKQFVTRLKELGTKARSPMKIEAVFVTAWAADQVDPNGWIQSAKLSGADLLFIFAFKKDLEQFRALSADSLRHGLRIRAIAVEQVALRTLYTDVLIELERGR